MSDAEIYLNEFGEDIIYHPGYGNPRRILAIVDRNIPASIDESPVGGIRQQITIHVANRLTDKDDDNYGGIGSDEVNTGGDKVTLSLRIGQETQTRPIISVIEQDDDMIALEIG